MSHVITFGDPTTATSGHSFGNDPQRRRRRPGRDGVPVGADRGALARRGVDAGLGAPAAALLSGRMNRRPTEGHMTETRGRPGKRPRRARVLQRTDEARSGDTGGAGAEVPSAPSEDAIRALAYELYLARGGAAGHALEDWLDAERALRGAAVSGTAPG
jgi:hypothetical protein